MEDLTSAKGTFEEFVEKEEVMEQPEQCMLRDHLTPNVNQQPLYITYSVMTCKFELKSA